MALDAAYRVTPEEVAALGWDTLFGRRAPRVVEVGFGNGRFLLEMAQRHPDVDWVGIELYGKGLRALSRALGRSGVTHVRLVKGEALALLGDLFAPASISAIHLNFPDPWPKRRHHKRRLVSPALAALLYSRMVPGGTVHLATDHDCYAFQMRTVFEAHPGFSNATGHHRFVYHIPGRTPTKYEAKFAARGATIRHLIYRRKPWH